MANELPASDKRAEATRLILTQRLNQTLELNGIHDKSLADTLAAQALSTLQQQGRERA